MSRLAWSLGLPAIRATARAAWHLKVEPGPGFPQPPFVIAANHLSFLDPPLIGAVYGRRVRFVALAELFGNHRSLDMAMDAFEVIRIHRENLPLGPLRECLAHLAGGGVVGLFPEGTRVSRFGEVGVRPGAAWLSTRAGVPLVPVAVTGTDQVLGIDNKLHRGRIQLTVGPALHPEGPGRPAVDELTRRWREWIESVVIHPSRPLPDRRS